MLGKSFERVYELLDELRAFLQQEKNQLADYLSETEFLLKLAYVCDIFDKLNKLNLSMQGAHKNVLDISNKITAFTCVWRFSVFPVFVKSASKEKYDSAFRFKKRVCATSILAL